MPCILKFEGKEKELTKAEKLIKSALSSVSSQDRAAEGTEGKENKANEPPCNNLGNKIPYD